MEKSREYSCLIIRKKAGNIHALGTEKAENIRAFVYGKESGISVSL